MDTSLDLLLASLRDWRQSIAETAAHVSIGRAMCSGHADAIGATLKATSGATAELKGTRPGGDSAALASAFAAARAFMALASKSDAQRADLARWESSSSSSSPPPPAAADWLPAVGKAGGAAGRGGPPPSTKKQMGSSKSSTALAKQSGAHGKVSHDTSSSGSGSSLASSQSMQRRVSQLESEVETVTHQLAVAKARVQTLETNLKKATPASSGANGRKARGGGGGGGGGETAGAVGDGGHRDIDTPSSARPPPSRAMSSLARHSLGSSAITGEGVGEPLTEKLLDRIDACTITLQTLSTMPPKVPPATAAASANNGGVVASRRLDEWITHASRAMSDGYRIVNFLATRVCMFRPLKCRQHQLWLERAYGPDAAEMI
jgi:hypothetical protein